MKTVLIQLKNSEKMPGVLAVIDYYVKQMYVQWMTNISVVTEGQVFMREQ